MVLRYSADGVEEERAEWQTEWASKPMPPPPPSIYNNKEEAIEAAKEFAKSHGYKLSIGPSYRNKVSNPCSWPCNSDLKYAVDLI